VLCVVYIHLTSRFIVRYALDRVIVADGLSKTPSGTPGLDDVLHGGVPAGRATVVSGGHGTGKAVLALQFLAAGDDGLSVGFEEREQELRRNASALGIDLSNVSILDLSPTGEQFFSDDSYTVFPTEEVDGEDLLDRIASELEASEIDRPSSIRCRSCGRCSPTTSSSDAGSPRCSTRSRTATSRRCVPPSRRPNGVREDVGCQGTDHDNMADL